MSDKVVSDLSKNEKKCVPLADIFHEWQCLKTDQHGLRFIKVTFYSCTATRGEWLLPILVQM